MACVPCGGQLSLLTLAVPSRDKTRSKNEWWVFWRCKGDLKKKRQPVQQTCGHLFTMLRSAKLWIHILSLLNLFVNVSDVKSAPKIYLTFLEQMIHKRNQRHLLSVVNFCASQLICDGIVPQSLFVSHFYLSLLAVIWNRLSILLHLWTYGVHWLDL